MSLFGTKAETLDRLTNRLSEARILPLRIVRVGDWKQNRSDVLSCLRSEWWSSKTSLIIRSSALNEDQRGTSQAGRYVSVPGVSDTDALSQAIDRVIQSYGGASNDNNQVLIQPYLTRAYVSGVAFSRDPEYGAPYYIINYSEKHGDTNTVTAGTSNNLRTFIISHYADEDDHPNVHVSKIIRLLKELKAILNEDSLDIEFAFDQKGELYLFQVRPLGTGNAVVCSELQSALCSVHETVEKALKPDPDLSGSRTLYGVMPDWNPAEIIGLRPRPLALSLYKYLLMDGAWAEARYAYGYKNCRSRPLMKDFAGLPYINLQLSFNSFLPAGIDNNISETLVDYYLGRLCADHTRHDKVEFDVVFSCYTPDLEEKINDELKYILNCEQQHQFVDTLKQMTVRILQGHDTWRKDIEKTLVLLRLKDEILNSNAPIERKIAGLLDICRTYGAIPFAGLARSAFIAMDWLDFLVSRSLLCSEDKENFIGGITTVSKRLTTDQALLHRAEFIKKYGHLRPGTYDILSLRYDEAPDLYFPEECRFAEKEKTGENFILSDKQKADINTVLQHNDITIDADALFEFMRSAIFWREESKFIFTQVLSDVFVLLNQYGSQGFLLREDLSFLDIYDFLQATEERQNIEDSVRKSIEKGRDGYRFTQTLHLPPLLDCPKQVWGFEYPKSEPNYITRNAATGPVRAARPENNLDEAIVMMPNADPGFDWIFSRKIKGFITAYGGMNSHMAIRALEMNIPAIIGAGECLYEDLARAEILFMDCNNRQVKIVR